MKIKEGFILREVAGKHIIVPVGEQSVDFNGLITINETGAFLWKMLENDVSEKELVSMMVSEYSIDEATAVEDISAFLNKLRDAELIVE